MAKSTGISWTRSTRNFWVGCTKVGPGCDGCYAEAFQRWIRGKDAESGEASNWGPGRPRVEHLVGAMRDLHRWNRAAIKEAYPPTSREHIDTTAPKPVNAWRPDLPAGFWPVFLNTQSDTFDNDVPQDWRDCVFATIEACPYLMFFLVTKRIGNVPGMVPLSWMQNGFPKNVRLIVTVVNQQEAYRDIPKLLALPCKNGVSYEPALGPVDWRPYLPRPDMALGLEWIIIGGESDQANHKARPFMLRWGFDTVRQCEAAGVPPFMKQTGDNAFWEGSEHNHPANFKDGGKDPEKWPLDIRVQKFPEADYPERIAA